MYSFWAMNSFRMSFWIVPDSDAHEAPCRSATTRYIAKIIAAGELIVIDVVMSGERDVGKERLHVGERDHRHAALPHLAERERVVRVAAHQRRQVEGDAQTGAARLEQLPVALVRGFRRPEPGKLAHRPELAPVAAAVDAARVRKRARIAEVAVVVERRHVAGPVDPLHRTQRDGPERPGAFAGARDDLMSGCCHPRPVYVRGSAE